MHSVGPFLIKCTSVILKTSSSFIQRNFFCYLFYNSLILLRHTDAVSAAPLR